MALPLPSKPACGTSFISPLGPSLAQVRPVGWSPLQTIKSAGFSCQWPRCRSPCSPNVLANIVPVLRADAEMGRGDPQRGTCRLPGFQAVPRGEQAVLGDQPGRVFGPEVERPRLLGRWHARSRSGPRSAADGDALAGQEEQLAVVFLKAAAGLRRRHVGKQLERLPGVVAAVDAGNPPPQSPPVPKQPRLGIHHVQERSEGRIGSSGRASPRRVSRPRRSA